jgi:ribosomal subunit interface protein
MKITLSGKQVDISDRLKNKVEEGINASTSKYFSAPISCSVAFSKDGEDFRAEVTVHPAKNIVLKGTGVAADPYSAFDNANEHIATRLRRQKTKLNDHKGKT